MDNRFYFGFNTSEERKKRRKAELYSMSEQVSTFFWDEAPQHGLEMREGQQDMSFEIVDALINDQHFAIEAGGGIGKSFGYLVPVSYTHLDVYKRQVLEKALTGVTVHRDKAADVSESVDTVSLFITAKRIERCV